MAEVHVYEPALCCNTGVCGPELDERLVAFTADLAHINAAGGHVQRHNLANDPAAFVADDTVRTFMHLAGSAGLPLTVVDGVTVLTGAYPSREQLTRYAALPDVADSTSASGPALTLTPTGTGADCCPSDSAAAPAADAPKGCC